MVTTYSGIFSYKGRDGKQHTLKGSVTTDASGNVVSIQGEGGAQVSDAVKEDFMNAFQKGTSVEAGYKIGDFVQLLQAYQRGQISDSQMASILRALVSNEKLKQDAIAGVAKILGRWKGSHYTTTKGVDEKFSAGFKGGLGVEMGGHGLGPGIGVSGGKTYGASEGDSRTRTYSENMLIASHIVNGGLEKFKGSGAREVVSQIMNDITQAIGEYQKETSKIKRQTDAEVDDVKPNQVFNQA